MEEARSDKLDIRWGREGVQRLRRLSAYSGDSSVMIARQALLEYELSRAEFRDTVREAVLELMRSLVPDNQHNPVNDSGREERALRTLGELLNSNYAAQGVADALSLLVEAAAQETANAEEKDEHHQP